MMDGRVQTTIRLTLRAPGGLIDEIEAEAKKENMSRNQYILKVLNQWRKSRHSQLHTP